MHHTYYNYTYLQEAPVVLAGSHETKKKYLGRMTEEPLIAVSNIFITLDNN